ncbi:MAG: hypothetical protein AABY06_01020 [Nanoarchaeota archaeon]
MNTKNRILISGILILIIVFLLLQINFINSQELTEIEGITSENTYHGTDYEFINGEIIFNSDDSKLIINQGKENEIIIKGNSGIKVSLLGKISIAESGSEFNLDGKDFKNIKSGDIEFDTSTGEITKVDFYTNENIGNYNINGNEFKVTENSRFFYDSKNREFKLYGDAEILNAKDVRISSMNDVVLNYKGNDVLGVLNFDSKGDSFISPTKKAVINGISITGASRQNVYVYFNSADAKSSINENYVALDENVFEYKKGKETQSFQVDFEVGNPYLNNMEENDFFGLFGGALGEEGRVVITPGFMENEKEFIPSIKTSGSVSIINDGIILEPIEKSSRRSGEFILRDYLPGKGKGAVETVSVSDMTKTIQIGSVVDNQGRIFFTSNHRTGEPLAVKDLTRQSVSKYSDSLELPLAPDIFSEEIRMSKSYVNLFSDKQIMTLTQNYKTANRGLENFQNSEKDDYLKAFQQSNLGEKKGTDYYNKLKEIVTDPTLTSSEKTGNINKLIQKNGPPPKIKASNQVVGYIRDISDLAFELEQRGVDAPFRREDFLGAKEIKGIDKIMRDEGISYTKAFDEYHKRTGMEVGPRIIFLDTSIPVKIWLEALEY